MTRLIVDGREHADEWDHLAGDEAPGGGSFTVGIVLVRTASADDEAAEAPASRSFMADVTATAPDAPARDGRTPGGRGFTAGIAPVRTASVAKETATAPGGGNESIAAIAPEAPARDSSMPPGRGFTVDAARWLAQRDDLIAHAERTGRPLGVRLAIDGDPMRLANDIGRFALIVIEIPSAADGRFFSIAARLREHLRYRHELRATGDVAPDQLSFMQRCGINAFEIGDHVDIERFIRRYRRFYQSSGPLTTRDNLIPSARRRQIRSRGHPRLDGRGVA